MKDFNYYHIVTKSNNEFDIHCDSIIIYGSGDIEFYEIWNDVALVINMKDIKVLSQINPLDAGMNFTCYNDLVRAFTEYNIGFEVVVDLYELT